MELKDIPESELSWTEKPIIGIVLKNAENDSEGNAINPMLFYKVAKHLPSGSLIIIPTKQNMKEDFVNDIFRKTGKFN